MPKEPIHSTGSATTGESDDERVAHETEQAEGKGGSAPKAMALKDNEFALNDLIENSNAIFGHPSYVIVGALHGQDPKPIYTKAEIQKAIDKFLAQEVS